MTEQEQKSKYTHILKYTGVFGGVQGLGILVSIVRTKLIAVILGAEGMGLMTLFNATIKLVSDSTNFGISMSAVKSLSAYYEEGNIDKQHECIGMIRSWTIFTALLGLWVCIIFSPLLDWFTFDWGDHRLHFVMLSPVVAFTAIYGSELAILKATRQLHSLAIISLSTFAFTLLLSIPLFYWWGESAIIPSMILVAFAQLVVTVYHSYRLYKPSFVFKRSNYRGGTGMIKLGLAYTLAGILGSAADLIIRSYLNHTDNLGVVGLFNAGYMMTMTYGGLVFTAMETDYFPRLSSITFVGKSLNDVVNRQVEVSLLLVAPMMVSFLLTLPILLPLFYTAKFLPVLGMMQVAVFAVFLRALTLPVAYLPLSRGDSLSYLFLETVYDVLVVLLIIGAYQQWELTGTGFGLALAGLFDLLLIYGYCYFKYQYTVSKTILKYVYIQFPFLLCTYLLTFISNPWIYWCVGIVLSVISWCVSFYIIKQKTDIMKRFRKNKSVDHD